MVDAEGIKEIEPHCVGLRAIHSPLTGFCKYKNEIKTIFVGIIDYQVVSRNYAKEVEAAGNDIICNYEVSEFTEESGEYPIGIKSNDGRVIRAKNVVTCAGLHSDRMAAKSGGTEMPKIVPFRGDYLLLKPDKAHWINGKYFFRSNKKITIFRKYLPSTRSKIPISGCPLHA